MWADEERDQPHHQERPQQPQPQPQPQAQAQAHPRPRPQQAQRPPVPRLHTHPPAAQRQADHEAHGHANLALTPAPPTPHSSRSVAGSGGNSSRGSHHHRDHNHDLSGPHLEPLDTPRLDGADFCGICLGPSTHPFALAACAHAFCGECLRQFVEFVRGNHSVRRAFCCPLCKQEVSDEDLRDLMGADFVTALLQSLAERAEEVVEVDAEVALQAQREFLRAARVHHFRYCPACNSPIQKNGGCDHMRCHCGHNFSWSRAIPVVSCNQVHWNIRHTGWRKYAATTCPGCTRAATAKLVAWRVGAGVLVVPCGMVGVVAAGVAVGLGSAAALSYNVSQHAGRLAVRRYREWKTLQERRGWQRAYNREIKRCPMDTPFSPNQESFQHDRAVEWELVRERRGRFAQCVLLVTGPMGSGKSTVIQSMRATESRASEAAALELATGYLDLLFELIGLVTAHIGLHSLHAHASDIASITNGEAHNPTWANAACNLLRSDSAFRAALDRVPRALLPPALHYFLQPTFHARFALAARAEPEPADLLHIHRRHSSTLSETVVEAEGVGMTLLEVSFEVLQHKLVVTCFDAVDAVVFVAALGDCFRPHPLEPGRCKIFDVLECFQALCSSHFYFEKPIILFLNQRDLFVNEIRDNPHSLRDAFPEYSGTDEDAALNFVLQQFLDVKFPHDRELYAHLVCALDKGHVVFVINSIKDILLTASLLNSGFI